MLLCVKLQREAEKRSAVMCEVCGEFGMLCGTKWVNTLFEEHSEHLKISDIMHQRHKTVLLG